MGSALFVTLMCVRVLWFESVMNAIMEASKDAA